MTKKIIKGSQLTEILEANKLIPPMVSASGLIRKEELSAKTKGEHLIDQAQEDAGRIRSEALALQARVSAEMTEAKKKGFEEGKEEGMAQFLAELKKVRALKEKIIAESEADLLQLVLSVSQKVLGEMVLKHKEAIHAILKQALERSLGDKITVRIHPKDLKKLQGDDLEFRDILDRTRHIFFKEDDSMELGGCIVETEVGTIDAQLETQLKAIKKALGM